MLVAGVLILLFIPYLLWGTGLATARSQDQLRKEFGVAQHLSGSSAVTHLAVPPTATPVVLAPHVAEPALGSPIGTIVIPKIGVSMVVVEGTGTAQLQQGPGHYPGTPLPGQAGNVAIAGHRTTYLHPFYNLNELVPGDPITITTLQGTFLYHVLSSESVSPSDVAVVAATSTPQLTLTTCNPRYSASQRLVVHAALVASSLTAPVPSTTVKPKLDLAPATATPRSWPVAILWGLAVAALTVGIWVLAGRNRRGRKALLIALGGVVWLVVVFFFFTALAPLLPASF